MELRHLRYFVAVGEELNFLRAADRLHISQPPLSQQIRDLEIELGVKLFDRSKRQIELTEAGRIFMQEVRLILAHVDRAADLALRASRGQVGQLRVGFMMPQHSRMVAEVFRLFAKEHSSVHLTSHGLTPTEQIMALREGRIDVAILRLPITADAELTIETIMQEPLIVALSEGHPLSSLERIPLRALSEQPCILRPRQVDPVLHDLVIGAYQKARATLKVAYEQTDIYTALGLVAAGCAITLIPSSIRELPIDHVVFRELQPPVPLVKTGMAYKRENKSVVLDNFLQVVRKVTSHRNYRRRGNKPR